MLDLLNREVDKQNVGGNADRYTGKCLSIKESKMPLLGNIIGDVYFWKKRLKGNSSMCTQ